MPAALSRPIALVGMPGAGKSTIGVLLAEMLGVGLVDLDALVERHADLPIAAIFGRYGEPGFRLLEREALAAALAGPVGVIATGGGTMADGRSGDLLRAQTLTVWLDAPVEVLSERIGGGPTRPLLGEDPRARLRELFAERRAAYERADLRVAADPGRAADVAAAVARAVSCFREGRAPPGR